MEGIDYTRIYEIVQYFVFALLTEIALIHPMAKKRKWMHRGIWLAAIGMVCICITYPLFCRFQEKMPIVACGILTYIFWRIAAAVTLLAVYCYYDIPFTKFLFYGLLALAMKSFLGTILSYGISRILLPGIQRNEPGIYFIMSCVVYIPAAWMINRVIAQKLKKQFSVVLDDDGKSMVFLIAVFLFMGIPQGLSTAVLEWSIGEGDAFESYEVFRSKVVPYFCLFVDLTINLIIVALQLETYKISAMEREKHFLEMLHKEKEQQYIFTKENIDMINNKCHDLKKQIGMLKQVGEDERNRYINEVEHAICFYDAIVKTGIDVLDTLLTECGMHCTMHKIRFTVNLMAKELGNIDRIDLYSMLRNVLDNAIECVQQYESPEKRIINLSIEVKSGMLIVMVDNYYEGEIKFEGGFPVTKKPDRNYHGYGLKSVKMVAAKYGGDMRINLHSNVFSIQIMVPQN